MRAAVLLLLILTVAGCTDPDPGVSLDLRRHRVPPSQGEVVATFADDALTLSDFEEAWETLPTAQQSLHSDPEGRRALVQRMVDFELLAREAARRDLHHDPRILNATKRLMVQRLLELERARAAAAVTDADLQAWYEAHLTDFRRPAEVQVSHLFLRHVGGAPPEALGERMASLEEASASLGLHDAEGFARLVMAHSEDLHSRSIGGDLRFRSHAELSQRFGAAVADAAFALRVPGERSTWIQGARGLHLLRLTARRPALALSLEQPETRERVRRAVQRDRERRAEAALLASLQKQAGVHLDAAKLSGAVPEKVPATGSPTHGRTNRPPGSPIKDTAAGSAPGGPTDRRDPRTPGDPIIGPAEGVEVDAAGAATRQPAGAEVSPAPSNR